MSELEMTKLCAAAMGLPVFVDAYGVLCLEQLDILSADNVAYDPLLDDAQAMALVKRFALQVTGRKRKSGIEWLVAFPFEAESNFVGYHTEAADLNRAIVECVAQMRSALSVGQDSQITSKPNERSK